MSAPKFSAAIVTYRPDRGLLERGLRSLATAIVAAREAGLVSKAAVYVVDNGPDEALPAVKQALHAFPREAGHIELVHGQGNVGYGSANNLVLPRLVSEYHLILNPDVELAPDALVASLRALQADGEVGIVAPAVRGADGERQYLCKRYPTVWVLFLRGFAPRIGRLFFRRSLDRYEMRDLPPDEPFAPVPLASGCFMLARTPLLKRLNGFDPGYFMYFEDYDLSLRAGRESKVAYVPQARIVHHGGEASRKGVKHIKWFLKSARRFFATHGWKIA
jgi:GT2 family glycosyltransferase